MPPASEATFVCPSFSRMAGVDGAYAVMAIGDDERAGRRRNLVGAVGELLQRHEDVVRQARHLVLPRLAHVDQINRFATLPHLM